jgi:hypothetical protein
MIDVFALTKTALDTLNPAVPFALSPYEGATLPDRYIVYQLIEDDAEDHADNVEIARSYTMQITTWDRNGLVDLPDIDLAMLAAGFAKGKRRQLPKDQKTGHVGIAQFYSYQEIHLQGE